MLSDNVTSAPPGGAFPVRVTVPVELAPPGTLVGLIATDVRLAGLTFSVAVLIVMAY